MKLLLLFLLCICVLPISVYGISDELTEAEQQETEYQQYLSGQESEVKKAEGSEKKQGEGTEKNEGDKESDFEHEDVYIDIQDALRSRAFVHRAIVSSAIDYNTQVRLRLGRYYINHLMGFNAIIQFGKSNPDRQFAKYVAGIQGFSVGYVTELGHALEAGLELSSVSSIFGGYRFFYRPEKYKLWPILGGGAGYEVRKLSISDGPFEAQNYDGEKKYLFGMLGAVIPLVDVALKIELRASFYGSDRWVFTQGIGAMFFL